MIGIELVGMLEKFHKMGYLHMDLKPDNIVVSKDLKKLHLIDYGISEKYINESGEHRM